MSKSHHMLRDANVVVSLEHDKKGHQLAHITVNDQFEHTFPAKSRVSQELQLVSPTELGARLSGGSYFFVQDSLIDFRDQRYHGFVHDDVALDSLMDTIGFTHLDNRRSRSAHRMLNRTSSNSIALSKVWSDHQIEVPMFNEGGVFTSEMNFTWNPFAKNVSSVYQLVRQICTNGMVGTTPFCNMQIPLVNRWEEHLDIANMQLQNKIGNMMERRLIEMSQSRASVGVIMLLDKHIINRLDTDNPGQNRAGLQALGAVVDPFTNLHPYYNTDVFENKAIAAQTPSHLSLMDAWNIATEVATHYEPTDGSSDAGLQKLANSIVFDLKCSTAQIQHLGSNIAESPFSSPERAFFGEVVV